MAEIVFEQVTKEFRDEKRGVVTAVSNANFVIHDGEFVVLVGPSGCGKTTTLRMIAGLERQTSGNIYIDGILVNDLHPKDRDIAMVFQDYALYPHMTVYENMSFGLRNLKRPKNEIDEKVKEAAQILGIEDLLDRRPRELSGGQRQRVALGRAVVRQPKVFLFDEPLSNLDAKLRLQMRVELAELHKRLGRSIVYVTHDQVEAMTLGERIVVMNKGVIQQIATPEELYETPCNLFVAGFIGVQTMNTIEVTCEGVHLTNPQFRFRVPERMRARLTGYDGKKLILGIRPENIHDAEDTSQAVSPIIEENYLEPFIKVVEYLGSQKLAYFDIQGKTCTAQLPVSNPATAGNRQRLYFDLAKAHIFDPETEEAL